MPPTLDLIIPHYGGVDILWRCLVHAFLFSPAGTRITVVDDCSPDNSPALGEWLNKTGRATYVRNAENRGYTFACMEGYRLTAKDPAPYFVFLNNDCCVMPGTLDLLLKVAKYGHPITCSPCWSDGRDIFDPTKYMAAVGIEDPPTIDNGFSFVCTIIARTLMDHIGGLDERFRQLFSDTDFILRAYEIGSNPVIVKEALIYHQGTVSGKRMGVKAASIQYMKDRDIFYEKWKHHPELFDQSLGGVNMSAGLEDVMNVTKAEWDSHAPR